MMKKKITITVLLLLLSLSFFVKAEDTSNNATICPEETYDLIIITSEEFSNAVQPLVQHKNNYGMNTFVKTVEDIYNEYTGRDNPEKIKYFIKDAKESLNANYVLLIGNVEIVPTRYILIYSNDTVYWPTRYIDADQYYSDLYYQNGSFCDWDENGNGIYGEFNSSGFTDEAVIDYLDLYPDIHVGRIPCRTIDEVTVQIERIITYETSTYGENWFKKILLFGGKLFPDEDPNEEELFLKSVGNSMKEKGISARYLLGSRLMFNPLLINLYYSIGSGFACYAGHGSLTTLVAYNRVDMPIYYRSFYSLGLLNDDKLTIVFLFACKTVNYTFSSNTLGIDFPCFASTLVMKSSGGAIACIGCSTDALGRYYNDGSMDGSMLLGYHFFNSYDEGITLGEMLDKAKSLELNDMFGRGRYATQVAAGFHLIGDPSLKVGGYP